jgi:hypothetical protein
MRWPSPSVQVDANLLDAGVRLALLLDSTAEMRQLTLDEYLDAESAVYRVEYNNASQFSRQYKSRFGDPPMRDVQRLRDAGGVSIGAQIWC